MAGQSGCGGPACRGGRGLGGEPWQRAEAGRRKRSLGPALDVGVPREPVPGDGMLIRPPVVERPGGDLAVLVGTPWSPHLLTVVPWVAEFGSVRVHPAARSPGGRAPCPGTQPQDAEAPPGCVRSISAGVLCVGGATCS